MDRWALKYRGQCSFVCVGCAGSSLAETFANDLKLRNCINVWLDDHQMPSWGQLGCNGFIVCDERHSVVCKATSAFMEVRHLAFKHVDTLVEALLQQGGAAPSALSSPLHPGAVVVLHSLNKQELNGVSAIILEAASAATGDRVVVQTRDGRQLKVKPSNLKVAGDSGDGCGGGCGDGAGCDSADGCVKGGGCDKTGGECGVGGGERMPSRMAAAMARAEAEAVSGQCETGS